MFLELMTMLLNTTQIKASVIIKGRKLMQYSPPMMSDVNIQSYNKFDLFHRDNRHDTNDCYTLKRYRKINC